MLIGQIQIESICSEVYTVSGSLHQGQTSDASLKLWSVSVLAIFSDSAYASQMVCMQVHRAVLHSGEQVVVKVQRPGLKNLFDIDLANLKLLAKQLDRMDDNSNYL